MTTRMTAAYMIYSALHCYSADLATRHATDRTKPDTEMRGPVGRRALRVALPEQSCRRAATNPLCALDMPDGRAVPGGEDGEIELAPE